MHLRLYVMRAAVVVFLLFGASCIAQTPEMEKQSAEIVGEVARKFSERTTLPGYAGRTFPLDGFPVYLFDWERSREIRKWLKRREQSSQAAKEDPQDSYKQWLVEKHLEEIHNMVTGLLPTGRTKSDDNGRFFFKNLKPGEKYLVIATKVAHEQGVILLYEIMGPLVAGKNKVQLVDKW